MAPPAAMIYVPTSHCTAVQRMAKKLRICELSLDSDEKPLISTNICTLQQQQHPFSVTKLKRILMLKHIHWRV